MALGRGALVIVGMGIGAVVAGVAVWVATGPSRPDGETDAAFAPPPDGPPGEGKAKRGKAGRMRGEDDGDGPAKGKKGGGGRGRATPDERQAAFQSLRTQAAMQEKLVVGYELRLGASRGWPEGAPEVLRPDAMYDVVSDTVGSCGQLGFLGLECAEAPCIAVLRDRGGDGAAAVPACAAWTEVYAGAWTDARQATCPTGTEAVLFVAPRVAGDEANFAATVEPKLKQRADEMIAGWQCSRATPATAPAAPPPSAPPAPPP